MSIPATYTRNRRVPWTDRKPFYGWIVVIIGAITQFAQGIVSQGFATYLGPLERDFGWSKATLAGPRSVTQIENSILGPIEGFLVDRLGPRIMIAIGTFALGGGLMLFGMTKSLWMYYFSNIIIAVGTGFQGLLVTSVAINHWFRRKRTVAQSIMLLGYALAGVIGVPALVYMQTSLSWQASAYITGVMVWVLGFPCAFFIFRSPEPYGLQPDGDTADLNDGTGSNRQPVVEEYDFSLVQALRTRAFWFLAIGQALGSLGMGAIGVHLFLFLENEVGLARSTAAFVWTVASISNIPARLVGGFFGDRMPKSTIIGATTVLMGLSGIVLGLAGSLPMAIAYALLYGIGWGARTPAINAIQGEYFGRKSQGIIRGWLTSLSIPIAIAAPVISGWVADTQGTYRLIFILMSCITLGGAAMLFMATPPKQPRH